MRRKTPVLFDVVLQLAAQWHGVRRVELFSASKRPMAVRARRLAWAILQRRLGASATEIGEWFSKNHSTVSGGIDAVSKDKGLGQDLDNMLGKLAQLEKVDKAKNELGT